MIPELELEMRYRRVEEGEGPMRDFFEDMFVVCKRVPLWSKSLVASHSRVGLESEKRSIVDVLAMRLPPKLPTQNGLQQLPDYWRVTELLDNGIAISRRTIFSECMFLPAR